MVKFDEVDKCLMKWTNVSILLFAWKHAIIKKLTTMVAINPFA